MISSSAKKICLSLLLITASISNANSALVLEDWIFNVDGTISEAYVGDALPTTGTLVDGLGTLTLEVTGAGSRSISTFFDYEIDQNINGFYNETAQAVGTAQNSNGIFQSWEIDEAKYFFGDIIDNVLAGSLDNTNAFSGGFQDDVGLGMGWDFLLLEGDIATLEFIFTDTLPVADFYLEQIDPDSGEILYMISTLDILSTGTPAGPAVPLPPVVTVSEPPISMMLMIGLMVMSLNRFTRNKRMIRIFKMAS